MTLLRQDRPSCFMITKGAMIEATYKAFVGWNLDMSLKENIKRIRETNYVGGPSNGWLKDFGKVLNRRFQSGAHTTVLIQLAQKGCDIDSWKPLLLWHMCRSDSLVYDFFANWLYKQYQEGRRQLSSESFRDYLRGYLSSRNGSQVTWSDLNIKSSAAGLAKIAVDFGILHGRRNKELTSYVLPEKSFLFLLHVMIDEQHNAHKVINSPEWRIFMMTSDDVQKELYLLHQYRKVEFDIAGSLAQLRLPCTCAKEYARKMI